MEKHWEKNENKSKKNTGLSTLFCFFLKESLMYKIFWSNGSMHVIQTGNIQYGEDFCNLQVKILVLTMIHKNKLYISFLRMAQENHLHVLGPYKEKRLE